MYDERKGAGTPPRFLGNPPIYEVFLKAKEYLNALCAGEGDYKPYPSKAVMEALANFIIHRDYTRLEEGRIEILDDRMMFINPGCSLVEEEALDQTLEREDSRHPSPDEHRNPNLVRAFQKATVGQMQGRGLIRIKQEIANNRSFKPDGSLGFGFHSNKKRNRFNLTLHRKSPSVSPQETWIAELNGQIKDLEQKLGDAKSENSKLQLQIQDLEGVRQRHDLLFAQKEKVDKSMRDVLAQVDILKGEFEQKSRELESAREDYISLDAQKQEYEQKLRHVQLKIAQLEGELQQKDKGLEDARTQHEQLFAQLVVERDRLKQARDDALLQIRQKDADLAVAKEKVDQLAAQKPKLEQDFAQVKQLVQDAQNGDKLQQSVKDAGAHGESAHKPRETEANPQRSLWRLVALALLGFILLTVVLLQYKNFLPFTVRTLQVNFGAIDAAFIQCSPDGTWLASLPVLAEGGHPPLVFYWNSREMTRSSSSTASVTLQLPPQRFKTAVEGTVFVVSADGQAKAKEIRIEAPSCP